MIYLFSVQCVLNKTIIFFKQVLGGQFHFCRVPPGTGPPKSPVLGGGHKQKPLQGEINLVLPLLTMHLYYHFTIYISIAHYIKSALQGCISHYNKITRLQTLLFFELDLNFYIGVQNFNSFQNLHYYVYKVLAINTYTQSQIKSFIC